MTGTFPVALALRGFEQELDFSPELRWESGSEKGCELGDDFSFAADANGMVLLGAAFEVDQRRDAANTELSGNAWGVIDVDLGDYEFSDVLSGDFIHHRAEHATGSAPWRPKVDQNRGAGGCDERSEIRVVEFGDVRIGHKRM